MATKPLDIKKKIVFEEALQQFLLFVFSIGGLAIATFSFAVASLFFGAYQLPVFDTILQIGNGFLFQDIPASPHNDFVFLNLRLPRIILGLAVGATLATSGAALQALFRNPLADPGLVGVTSGAMVFTVAGNVSLQPLILIAKRYAH